MRFELVKCLQKVENTFSKISEMLSSEENELRGMVIQHFGTKIFQKNLPFLDGYI